MKNLLIMCKNMQKMYFELIQKKPFQKIAKVSANFFW